MVQKLVKFFLAIILFQGVMGTLTAVASPNYQYEYDSNNRLIVIKKDGVIYKKYTYDANGNLLLSTVGNRPKVEITSPVGTRQTPSEANSDELDIAWKQTDEDQDTEFHQFQVRIMNAKDEVLLDTGAIAQDTAMTANHYLVNQELPPNDVLKVSVRISDEIGWSTWSTPQWFQIPEAVPSNNLLKNPGFETSSTNPRFGWEVYKDGAGSVETVATPASQGSKALRIEASGLPLWQNNQVEQTVAVQGGQPYTLGGQISAETLVHVYVQLSARFYDANGQIVGEQQYINHLETTGGYIELEQKGMIPQEAVKAKAIVSLIANENEGSGVVYVDSMHLAYGVEANLLGNGGFEYSGGNDMSIWSKSTDSATTGQISIVSSPVQSGSRALKIDVAGMPAWNNAQVMQETAIEGGKQYRLSGDLRGEQLRDALSDIQVVFYDESNQELARDRLRCEETTAGYIHLEKVGTIPQNAVKAQVAFMLVATADNGGGVVYADNLELVYTVETNLLVNPDFENTAGTKAIDPLVWR
ncbi:MAG: carbohydrate binding domain-containing protein [Gorillibacterium sp.]|nr:carbohydrate binding domain-containing protein [Gorillibacterium sp.]